MKPSVGRIVHYSESGTTCRAAVVTGIRNDHGIVDLAVFYPGGVFFDQDVQESGLAEHSAMYPPETWHWPERVPE